MSGLGCSCSAAVAAASSGGVPPPESAGGVAGAPDSRTETVRELAGGDACATVSASWSWGFAFSMVCFEAEITYDYLRCNYKFGGIAPRRVFFQTHRTFPILNQTMSKGNVTLETRNQVLLIGLNRVNKRNAFDLEMYRALAAAYGELHRNPDLRCGVLFANGEHFTGGIDLTEWAALFREGRFPDLPEGALDPLGLD